MYPFASLPENLAAFCDRLRRQHGFHIGPGELHDAARALEVVPLADERAIRHALRPILATSQDDAAAFDAAFTRFFFRGVAAVPPEELPAPEAEPGTESNGPDAAARARTPPSDSNLNEASGMVSGAMTPLELGAEGAEEAAVFAPSSYSPFEADTPETHELPRLDPLWGEAARVFVRRLHLGLSRRWRPTTTGRRFDLRRTLRAGLQTGGEALSPRWLRRPRRTPRIVLLLDGSRSMSGYTRTALHMAVALASATLRVEVFTFSTRLQRVTGEVRRAAAGDQPRLAWQPHAWAGGTSIGACLRDFLQRFGERMVGRDTVVVVASDGLDVGEPEILGDAMRELHRRAASVVWLNPLLDTDGYEPTAAGMSAARPFIATFASVADQAGLARLARVLRVRS